MKEFEHEIISKYLLSKNLHAELKGETEIEYSGVGYFLTVTDPKLPKEHMILSSQIFGGHLGGVEVGFLGIILNSEFTLECYSYGKELLPEHREQGYIPYAT